MEAINLGMLEINAAWVPPLSTEIMAAARQIVESARQVYKLAEKMKLKQPVTPVEFREVLDGYDNVKMTSTTAPIFHGKRYARKKTQDTSSRWWTSSPVCYSAAVMRVGYPGDRQSNHGRIFRIFLYPG